ncbi:MAG: hypothetical protein WC998_08630, partial [Candidatus Paceibacterota bacterium]
DLGGVADTLYARGWSYTASGLFTLGGSAVTESTPREYLYVASGGLVLGGSALTLRDHQIWLIVLETLGTPSLITEALANCCLTDLDLVQPVLSSESLVISDDLVDDSLSTPAFDSEGVLV